MTYHTQTVGSRRSNGNEDNRIQSDGIRSSANPERVWTLAEQASMARELANLRQQLASLPVIEQSKGLLMGYYGIDADTAFAVLRRWSSHTNLKLRVISCMLVDAATEPDAPEPDDSEPDWPDSNDRPGLAEIIQSLQDVHRGNTPAAAGCHHTLTHGVTSSISSRRGQSS